METIGGAMKAAVIESLGRAPVYADYAEPEDGNGATVATVEAAALTNLNRGLVAGTHYGSAQLTLPSIAGIDGVARLADGRRVYGRAVSPYGMMAERTRMDPRTVVDVPADLDAVTAAAAPNPGLSAWMTLHHGAQVEPGHRILVLGATGVTGSLAVQLAQEEFGAGQVVAVGRNAERLAWLRSRGADTLQLGQGSLRDQVAAHHRERPFDAVIDYLWGEPAEQVLVALGNEGLPSTFHATRFVQVGSMAGATANLSAGTFRSAGVSLVGVGIGSLPPEVLVRSHTEFLPKLWAMLADGRVQLTTEQVALGDVEARWAHTEPSGTRVVFVP